MSASLVGSEMCIRDRRCSGQVETPAWLGPTSASTITWRSGCRQVWRPLPVSYTHLTLPTICSV
eukprot:8542502-Alexandrium_andersonii.AAC.1